MKNKIKYNILIVDDVADNLVIVEKILISDGYSIEKAVDGLSALRLVNERDFDLILLDIMMPIMSGLDVCRYLKVDPKTASIPVIFLTANADRDTLTKAYSVGGSDYIRKPFFKEELLARVSSRLKLRDYEKNLEQKVELRTKEISDTQVKLMHVLGGISEGHSVETYLHVKRVTEFTYKLAKLYGMDDQEAKMLKDASSLHDIGKLGVRDNILHKRDKLTKKEYKEMQKHVVFGVDMLKYSELPLFKAATIVVNQHHEKYDGTGYPHKLKGTNIHIYGRIVALADVFDALLNKRSYKEKWTQQEVISYIKDMSGKHFDPNLINIFTKNIDVFLNIYDLKPEAEVITTKINSKKRGKIMEWLLGRL